MDFSAESVFNTKIYQFLKSYRLRLWNHWFTFCHFYGFGHKDDTCGLAVWNDASFSAPFCLYFPSEGDYSGLYWSVFRNVSPRVAYSTKTIKLSNEPFTNRVSAGHYIWLNFILTLLYRWQNGIKKHLIWHATPVLTLKHTLLDSFFLKSC